MEIRRFNQLSEAINNEQKPLSFLEEIEILRHKNDNEYDTHRKILKIFKQNADNLIGLSYYDLFGKRVLPSHCTIYLKNYKSRLLRLAADNYTSIKQKTYDIGRLKGELPLIEEWEFRSSMILGNHGKIKGFKKD